MMEHFGRTWDGELVTIHRVYTGKNRKGESVFKADAKDITGQTFQIALGKTYGYSQGQCFLEAIGKMPLPGKEMLCEIEAIVKLLGRGHTYVIDMLMVDDHLLECVKTEDIRPGDWIYVNHKPVQVTRRSVVQFEAHQNHTLQYAKTDGSDPKFNTGKIVRSGQTWTIRRQPQDAPAQQAKAS